VERYGWMKRALPADVLDALVDRSTRDGAAPPGVVG
jgi:hypothetical protein